MGNVKLNRFLRGLLRLVAYISFYFRKNQAVDLVMIEELKKEKETKKVKETVKNGETKESSK